MKKFWLATGLATMGLVGTAAIPLFAAEKGSKEEGKEVKVSLDDVPKAVRKTLKREAFGARLESVDKETLEGKTVYEADAVIDGTNYEILVDESGKLLSKKIDAEDEEKEAKVEKPKAEKSEKKDEDERPTEKAAKSERPGDEKASKTERKKTSEDDDEKPSKKRSKQDKEDQK